MDSLGKFHFSWNFFVSFFANWQMACSGITIALASAVWFYILRHFPFSMAYPMISLSYVLGMLAAVFIFHENVSLTRWLGVAFILIGVICVAKH